MSKNPGRAERRLAARQRRRRDGKHLDVAEPKQAAYIAWRATTREGTRARHR